MISSWHRASERYFKCASVLVEHLKRGITKHIFLCDMLLAQTRIKRPLDSCLTGKLIPLCIGATTKFGCYYSVFWALSIAMDMHADSIHCGGSGSFDITHTPGADILLGPGSQLFPNILSVGYSYFPHQDQLF